MSGKVFLQAFTCKVSVSTLLAQPEIASLHFRLIALLFTVKRRSPLGLFTSN